jgi:hypothetical protein
MSRGNDLLFNAFRHKRKPRVTTHEEESSGALTCGQNRSLIPHSSGVGNRQVERLQKSLRQRGRPISLRRVDGYVPEQRHGKQQRLQPGDLRTHDHVHPTRPTQKTAKTGVQAEGSDLAGNLPQQPPKSISKFIALECETHPAFFNNG